MGCQQRKSKPLSMQSSSLSLADPRARQRNASQAWMSVCQSISYPQDLYLNSYPLVSYTLCPIP